MTHPLQLRKFAFFGTSLFATIVLDELEKAHLVPELVVTAPDARSGRGMRMTSTPVKTWAIARGIKVAEPAKLTDIFATELRAKAFDVGVLASYGKLVPTSVIDAFPKGIVNVHPSLLPKHRGASPIESQILSEDDWRDVGVSIMLLTEGLDEGPVLTEEKEIESLRNRWPLAAPELERILAKRGGLALANILPMWVHGTVRASAQDKTRATYAKKIKKEHGEIDVSGDARLNYRKFLAYEPWPGAYFYVGSGENRRLVKIAKATLRDGAFVIERVIPEGRREMDYKDFLRGLNG